MDFTSREQGYRDFTNIPFNQARARFRPWRWRKLTDGSNSALAQTLASNPASSAKTDVAEKAALLGCLRLCDQALQSEGIAGERPGSPGPAQVNVKDVFVARTIAHQIGPGFFVACPRLQSFGFRRLVHKRAWRRSRAISSKPTSGPRARNHADVQPAVSESDHSQVARHSDTMVGATRQSAS